MSVRECIFLLFRKMQLWGGIVLGVPVSELAAWDLGGGFCVFFFVFMGIVMEWSVGFVGVWVMGCVDWIGWDEMGCDK